MGQRPKLVNFSDLSEGRKFIFTHPLGYRKDGRPILRIAGGAEGDDDEDDDDETSGGTGSSPPNTVPFAKYFRTRERMRNADRRANKAETRVTELEGEASKVPDLDKKLSDAKAVIQKLRIDNAFLTATDVDWLDSEVALRLVDLTKVEITESGEVKGLAEALKELAEKKPFLVKKKEEEKGKGKGKSGDDESEDDDDEEDVDDEDEEDDTEDQDETDTRAAGSGADRSVQNGRKNGGSVSGTSTGSGKRGKRGKGKGPTDSELMARYNI